MKEDEKKIQGLTKVIHLGADPGTTGDDPLKELRAKGTYTCPGPQCDKLSVIVLSAHTEGLVVVVKATVAAV